MVVSRRFQLFDVRSRKMRFFDKVFGKKIAKEITPSCDDAYNKLLNDCVAEVKVKNQTLSDEFGFGSFERWDIDQEIGDILPKSIIPANVQDILVR